MAVLDVLLDDIAGQPFVNHDAKRVLIARRDWLALNLFGSHVTCRADDGFPTFKPRTLRYSRDTEIAEQEFVLCSKEDVLRLDIPMNASLVMGILQGSSDLFDVCDNDGQRKASISGMVL